jgi:hypothetical protein
VHRSRRPAATALTAASRRWPNAPIVATMIALWHGRSVLGAPVFEGGVASALFEADLAKGVFRVRVERSIR